MKSNAASPHCRNPFRFADRPLSSNKGPLFRNKAGLFRNKAGLFRNKAGLFANNVPLLRTIYSQLGNILFPGWEQNIPPVGNNLSFERAKEKTIFLLLFAHLIVL